MEVLMERPYVGITGFMSGDEVTIVLGAMPKLRHALMVGVLASDKTLNGMPSDYPNRYPKIQDIAAIFVDDPRVLNLVHYHAKYLDALERQLEEIVAHGGPHLHGIQLNLDEPPLRLLQAFKVRHPDQKLVIQANHSMFRRADYSPQRLARKAAAYASVAEYLMFDLSGGNGMQCSSDMLRNFVVAMKAEKVPMQLGISGGFGVYTLHTVKQLLREYPDLSIDAERRLRTDDDHLDTDLAVEYLQRAARCLAAE